MPDDLMRVIIPLLALLLNISSQMLSFRILNGLGLLKSEYLGFAVGFLSLFFGKAYAYLPVNIIIYLALAYLYFTFVNLGETARRVRILSELNEVREGLTYEELLKCYNAKMILEKRIDRLVKNKQIVCREDRYYVGSCAMFFISRAIEIMKLILLKRTSEHL
jgi:hypothetical protein